MELIEKKDYILDYIEVCGGIDRKSLCNALRYKHGIIDEDVDCILNELTHDDYLIPEQGIYAISPKGLIFLEKGAYRNEQRTEKRKQILRIAKNVCYLVMAILILGISCQRANKMHKAAVEQYR
jgi:hypothetical protein